MASPGPHKPTYLASRKGAPWKRPSAMRGWTEQREWGSLGPRVLVKESQSKRVVSNGCGGPIAQASVTNNLIAGMASVTPSTSRQRPGRRRSRSAGGVVARYNNELSRVIAAR